MSTVDAPRSSTDASSAVRNWLLPPRKLSLSREGGCSGDAMAMLASVGSTLSGVQPAASFRENMASTSALTFNHTPANPNLKCSARDC